MRRHVLVLPIPRSLIVFAAFAGLIPAILNAQAAGETTIYPAVFFTSAQPATAYDMVVRLPGFSFDGGDSAVRGLAGTQGNVLVDGRRPATKQDSLENVLKRIPARAVLRIDLIRSGAEGVDMGGQSIVANIIRRTEASMRGEATAQVGIYGDGRATPSLAATLSRRTAGTLSEASITLEQTVDDTKGRGPRARINPDGGVRQLLLYDEHDGFRNVALSLGHERDLAGGRLRLNASAKRDREQADTSLTTLLPAPTVEQVQEIETITEGEIGLDWNRPLGSKLALEVIALKRLNREVATETSNDADEGEFVSATSTGGETIGRAILRWQPRAGLAIEGGGEVAFNMLDSHATLTVNGVPVLLPAANVRVAEHRAEGFATATWQTTSKLSVEGSVRVETSRLVQSGDATLEKDFVFAKPSLRMNWSVGPLTKLRARIERTVGQLDFSDFVSSTSLTSSTITAGNQNLEPDRRWIAALTWERQLPGAGALVVTAQHEWISSVVDRIGVNGGGEVFDARGNIGNGTKTRIGANLLLPLDRLTLPGGLIKLDIGYRWTSVIDPTTGIRRPISGEEPIDGAAHFTIDRPQLKLRGGIDAAVGTDEREYRFNEVRRARVGTRFSAFVEYRPWPKWTLRAFADNITGRHVRRERAIYAGPRSTAPLRYVEQRDLVTQPLVGLLARREF